MNAFCISKDEEPVATISEAVSACLNKLPEPASMCRSDEWMQACLSGIPTNMIGNWEMIPQHGESAGFTVVGNGDCLEGDNQYSFTAKLHYRCCMR